MTDPPSRPEARSRFGPQSANELGASVASSTPEQLPGHEPASARKGYEDGNALFRRHRCVEGSFGRYGIARGAMLFGQQRSHRLGQTGRAVARLLDRGDRGAAQTERETTRTSTPLPHTPLFRSRVWPEGQCSSVSNDPTGWANLVEQLRGSSIAAIEEPRN